MEKYTEPSDSNESYQSLTDHIRALPKVKYYKNVSKIKPRITLGMSMALSQSRKSIKWQLFKNSIQNTEGLDKENRMMIWSFSLEGWKLSIYNDQHQ